MFNFKLLEGKVALVKCYKLKIQRLIHLDMVE